MTVNEHKPLEPDEHGSLEPAEAVSATVTAIAIAAGCATAIRTALTRSGRSCGHARTERCDW